MVSRATTVYTIYRDREGFNLVRKQTAELVNMMAISLSTLQPMTDSCKMMSSRSIRIGRGSIGLEHKTMVSHITMAISLSTTQPTRGSLTILSWAIHQDREGAPLVRDKWPASLNMMAISLLIFQQMRDLHKIG